MTARPRETPTPTNTLKLNERGGLSMLTTIEYQGYTIKAPAGPSEQGNFTPHPTPTQVVQRVDVPFLLYWEPPSFDTLVGNSPANELIPGTVTFQCYWDTIANVVAQQAQATKSVEYAAGITTTDSDTKKFSVALGLESATLEGLKATLSATFSTEETHSVALSESRTIKESYTAMPGTTLQVWQLHAEYIVEFEKDGKSYRYTLAHGAVPDDGCILELSFPEAAS
jgi:hypothetical protein